jgi:hypothetical protein
MPASPHFFVLPPISSGWLGEVDLHGYAILFNFIQHGPYCPCFSSVVYLVATEAEFEQATPVQETLP